MLPISLLPISLTFELLGQYGQASSAEGERRQAELQAEREREAEQRRAHIEAMRAGGAMAP